MPGIKVEVKKGRRWWYVSADFGDGNPPVTKSPMNKEDAEKMAAELEGEAGKKEGVVLLDASKEEEAANRKVAFAFFAVVGCLLLGIILMAVAAVSQ